MRDLTEHAVWFAQQGWRVLPLFTPNGTGCDCNRKGCSSVGKHPRITDWVNNASTDVEQVTGWWGTWPHANIGIATGAASGIVVLDIDPRHGGDEEIQRLINEHGRLPSGPACVTGSGGEHYYFAHPGGRILSRTIAPGIDVRGDGGQVVAPPSFHATGMSYEWYDEHGPELPLPAIPDWLLLLMQQHERTFETAKDVPKEIGEGGRNNALAALGGAMRHRGFGETAIFAALMAENLERCSPALDRTEVATIAASVARYEPQEGILVLSGTGQARAAEKPTVGAARPRVEPRTLTMAELQHEELPAMKMAVPDLMPIGLALLAGRLKMGKSWMMLGIGCAIAEGGIALGQYPVEDGDVLYIAYEDTKRRLQSRGRVLLGDGQWPGRMYVAPSGYWPTREAGGLEAIDSWLGAHPAARMVVIDTLQRFRGGGGGESDKNAYAADYNVSAEVQELALKHEVVIVAVHHFRKSLSETDWVDQISGTNGIGGAADTLMGFERKRGEKTAILKTTGRDIDEGEFALAFDESKYGWIITGSAEDFRLVQDAGEFGDALLKVGNGGAAHYRAIADEMGMKHNSVFQMGKRLAAVGKVLRHGGGLYGPVPGGGIVSTVSTEGILASKAVDTPLTSVDSLSKAPGSPAPPLTALTSLSMDLSTVSEAKTAPVDSVDKIDEKPLVAPPRPWVTTPEHPCEVCGEMNWLKRAVGGWVCGTCKPWLTTVEAAAT